MGKHKKTARPKSSVTISDPHYTEYDMQKERNIQGLSVTQTLKDCCLTQRVLKALSCRSGQLENIIAGIIFSLQ